MSNDWDENYREKFTDRYYYTDTLHNVTLHMNKSLDSSSTVTSFNFIYTSPFMPGVFAPPKLLNSIMRQIISPDLFAISSQQRERKRKRANFSQENCETLQDLI